MSRALPARFIRDQLASHGIKGCEACAHSDLLQVHLLAHSWNHPAPSHDGKPRLAPQNLHTPWPVRCLLTLIHSSL